MRIISGKYKRRKLITPRNLSIRPTTDKQRESLFNILADDVVNTRVLDLYAGTGALGIEAISRGAQSAVFVDNNRQAIQIIKKNIKQLEIGSQTTVFQRDINRNLSCLGGYQFDLIFMDPPYQHDYIDRTLIQLCQKNCLADHSLIVAEHAISDQMSIPDDLVRIDYRVYGQTQFSFLEQSRANASEKK